ncbi:MAG: putative polymerase sigma factor [Actinomycetia bacterium]|nr:putative polymerase sigma factor [Actinomycetes bacterium]
MIEQHLPLVRHIVFQVAVRFPRHVDREDLARAGALGLVEAARRYDGARGVPFERFAAQRIRGAILDAVRSADWAPRSVRTLARTLEQTNQQLASTLGRPPTIDEMADAMATTPDEVARLQDRIHRSVVLALDHHLATDGEDDAPTLADTVTDGALEPSEALERRELHAYLRDAVRLLPERNRLVVIGYFLEGRSSGELARFLGITESRVSQLRSEALGMLRDAINAQYEDEVVPVERRTAGRRASLAAALSESSAWRDRLNDVPADR